MRMFENQFANVHGCPMNVWCDFDFEKAGYSVSWSVVEWEIDLAVLLVVQKAADSVVDSVAELAADLVAESAAE